MVKQKRVKRKFKKIKKRFLFSLAILTAVAIVLKGLLNTTLGMNRNSDSRLNDFGIGDFKTALIEEFDDKEATVIGEERTKKVSVKNTGETAGFVRVLVIPEIIAKKDWAGNQLLLPAAISKEVLLLDGSGNQIADNENWIYGGDGYYYYLKALKPGQTTPPLFEKVELSSVNNNDLGDYYQEASLSIEVKVEGINDTQWAYRDAWWGSNGVAEGSLEQIDEKLKEFAREEER